MWSLLLACALSGGGDEREPLGAGWTELDAAVARAAAAPQGGPLSWGVLLRTFYTASASEASAGTEDISGQVFEDVDVYFAFESRDVAWRVSADFDQGNPGQSALLLEDAHACLRHADWLALTVGQFKPRVVRTASLPASELLFRERSFLGAAFDAWDDGLELGGHYDQFDYWLALTDGANGADSDHFLSARVEWALADAAFADREGALDAPNHLRVLLAFEWFSDNALSTSHAAGYGTDLALTFGPYAYLFEWANLERDFARTIDVFNGHLLTLGDGHPFGSTLSRRMLQDGELALRFQRADDADDTSALSLGASWSPGGGAGRLVADVAFVDGDTRDFSLFSVGLQVGSSGLTRPFVEDGGR